MRSVSYKAVRVQTCMLQNNDPILGITVVLPQDSLIELPRLASLPSSCARKFCPRGEVVSAQLSARTNLFSLSFDASEVVLEFGNNRKLQTLFAQQRDVKAFCCLQSGSPPFKSSSL